MTKNLRILAVDDEPGMLEICGDSLEDLENVTLVLEPSSSKAAERLADEKFDLLLTDIRMPGVDGLELLRIGREHDPELPAVVMTAYPTVDSAIEVMKLGAVDYIQKPFHPDDLLATVRRLCESRRLQEENRWLHGRLEKRHEFGEIVGGSEAMRRVFDTIERVADSDVDVLVHGETGTGKELVARSVHQNSGRKSGRFVPVDCGAIPANLLESEFFGYERGAFTGAQARSIGLMEYADGGTLFLDEVAELPVALQAKLLRALQERRVRRVGGNVEIPVDVRIVAATSRDLEKMIAEGEFREDLYYRINVVRIDLPPLRDREGDIELLLERLVAKYAKETGRPVHGVDAEAVEVLRLYRWPGNVRELQNVVRRGIALTRGDRITLDDLPESIVISAGAAPRARPVGSGDGSDAADCGFFEQRERRVAAFERDYISRLLDRSKGDVTAAAKEARLPRGTLYRLMKNHGIRAAEYRKKGAEEGSA